MNEAIAGSALRVIMQIVLFFFLNWKINVSKEKHTNEFYFFVMKSN